jgi:hypothetical protein
MVAESTCKKRTDNSSSSLVVIQLINGDLTIEIGRHEEDSIPGSSSQCDWNLLLRSIEFWWLLRVVLEA